MKKVVKNKIEELKKKRNGITLIALVITIIVLLILAGVSIATLTGENGILIQAESARESTRAGEVEETVELWKTEKRMNDYGEGKLRTEEELLQELLEKQKVTEEEINRGEKTITIGSKVISYAIGTPLTDIYVALYTDGTLAFSNNEEEIETSQVAENGNYGNIRGQVYKYVWDEDSQSVDTSKMPPWYESVDNITKVKFLSNVVANETACWFNECIRVTEIENLNYLNTSNVTDMSYMFSYCDSLSNLDLSNIDTSNVTDMSGMFCRSMDSLASLDLSSFDTSNVTNMSYMFYEASITNLDVSNFNTSKVTDMSGMFAYLQQQTIDLSNFDTSNVINMSEMFDSSYSLQSIDISNFNTSKVTDMRDMFRNCSDLNNLDLSSFNTSNVIDMESMFENCKNLNTLDLSNFNTGKVTNMRYMFLGVTAPVTINSNTWNASMTEAETDYGSTFTKI